jgi:hypothetical protein
MPSTLAPNFSVPCGRPALAISGGATGAAGVCALCAAAALASGHAAPSAAAAVAMPKNVRRFTPLAVDILIVL